MNAPLLRYPVPPLTQGEQLLRAICIEIRKMDVHDLSEVLSASADRATALNEVNVEAHIQDALDALQLPSGDPRADDNLMDALEVMEEMRKGRKPE
jgi:hypothetical protein